MHLAHFGGLSLLSDFFNTISMIFIITVLIRAFNTSDGLRDLQSAISCGGVRNAL